MLRPMAIYLSTLHLYPYTYAVKAAPNWWGARRFPAERPVLRQPACKPGSVRRKANNARFARDGHSSGTPVARRLEQPTRAADPDIDPGIAPRAAPIRSCSRWGLPCRLRCRRRGALLPHRFTLAAGFSPRGGLRFLWHFPWGHPRRTLSGTACPWSPDFPPRRPFGPCRGGHPAD